MASLSCSTRVAVGFGSRLGFGFFLFRLRVWVSCRDVIVCVCLKLCDGGGGVL